MSFDSPYPFDVDDLDRAPYPAERARVTTLGPAVLLRAALAFLALAAVGALAVPAMAGEGLRLGTPAEHRDGAEGAAREAPRPAPAAVPGPPRLRGDVTARGDVLTLADLVENVPEWLAARPLFRAPALGSTGTIQSRRIVDAAAALGLAGVETGGRAQVAVQRAARRVGVPEIEAAFRRALEAAYALDPRAVAIRLDGDGPGLLAPTDLNGQAVVLDLTYDPRSHRVAGLVSLGDRQASLRASGLVVELREVAVLARPLARGEAVRPGDLALERRPRDAVEPDAQVSDTAALGEVAQRALPAGAVLRAGDTAPPELVARGEAVTIVYEAPGISLSMRGLAGDGGRMGAVISVTNIASKKVLQATIVGPGRVSVGPGAAGPQLQASAALPAAR